MKRIIFTVFTAVVCMCTSCNTGTKETSGTKDDSQQQKNIAAAGVVVNAFKTGDINSIDSVVSDDLVDHTERGDVKGKDSLKAMIITAHKNAKDMSGELLNSAASGDYVYQNMRYKGTSDGSMGMPKGPYDFIAIELVKFMDGKIVEHWNFMQAADMMKMMPQQPGMNNMGKHDSTGMKK